MFGIDTAIWVAIIGAIVGAASAASKNKTAASQQRRQQRFQERMSSTAYQRGMQDLRSGGLNPILAGGRQASSPGGSMADIKEVLGPSVSSATAMYKQNTEIKALRAQTLNTQANTAKTLQDIKRKKPFGVVGETVGDLLQGAKTSAKDIAKDAFKPSNKKFSTKAKETRRQKVKKSILNMESPTGKKPPSIFRD